MVFLRFTFALSKARRPRAKNRRARLRPPKRPCAARRGAARAPPPARPPRDPAALPAAPRISRVTRAAARPGLRKAETGRRAPESRPRPASREPRRPLDLLCRLRQPDALVADPSTKSHSHDQVRLDHLADQEGVSFIETKPEVCWQLPLRRGYEDLEYEDGSERLVVVLGEYDRSNWGEGGHDFPWYCTGNPEAHVATDPVYVGSRDEIIALIGQPAYDVLADLCDKREALLRANPTDAALAPHPADPVP